MTVQSPARVSLAEHGAVRLPAVNVDCYNLEIKDEEGFIGDRANKSAFWDFIEQWRKALRKGGDDPFGDKPTGSLSKDKLGELLGKGDPEAAGVVHGAIEAFAGEFAHVIQRFLKLKSWKDTERIVVGGGFREGRLGEITIGRTAVILQAEGVDIELKPIRNDPDEAGLIGAAQLAPRWMFEARDAILAVDIGGTNIRAGIVELNLKKASDLSKAAVWELETWRHGEERNVNREDTVEKLVEMLEKLILRSKKEKLRLAPFVGIGCPGKIVNDGSIESGAQNLPGNWESSRFNLPGNLCRAIPKIGEHDTAVIMHNDAVVQGLSEAPHMSDVKRWGVLTVGTGLGNARFTNRAGD